MAGYYDRLTATPGASALGVPKGVAYETRIRPRATSRSRAGRQRAGQLHPDGLRARRAQARAGLHHCRCWVSIQAHTLNAPARGEWLASAMSRRLRRCAAGATSINEPMPRYRRKRRR